MGQFLQGLLMSHKQSPKAFSSGRRRKIPMFQLGERLQHQLILIREQGINPTKQFTSKATWLSVLLLLDLAQSDQMTWISTPQPSECRKCGFSLHRTQTPPPVPQSVLEQERRGCSRPEIQLLNIYFFSFSPPSYFNFFFVLEMAPAD